MDEALTKAVHNLDFALGDLREALNKSSHVEYIILIDLIRSCADLYNKVNHFKVAKGNDN